MNNKKLEHLVDLAGALYQQNDFQEILRLVTQQAASLLCAEMTLILMVNPRTRHTVKTLYKKGGVSSQPHFHAIHNQLAGWVMTNHQSLLSADITKDSRFARMQVQEVSIKSVMCVPLKSEAGMIGTLLLWNKLQAEAFDEDDLAYLEKFVMIAAPYLHNVQKIREYFQPPFPETALLAKYAQAGLLGKSLKFVELLKAIDAAARCDVRVLLEGQTGTGKELVARAIHHFSTRSRYPIIAMDCGAIPAHLIESELFGHLKGAFTGATQDRKGLLEEANHGTLFMDEVANLSLDMQAKFMRTLEQGEIRPLGSNKIRKIDVRIISASSRILQELVKHGQFREDLYYRLYVYPILVPSLDERRQDIPLLAQHFLQKFSSQHQKQVEALHETLLDHIKQRRWEGNIRELENFIERLVVVASPDIQILGHDTLPANIKRELKRHQNAQAELQSLTESLAEYEARLIRQALEINNWNQSKVARKLKIPVQTLQYKMKKLGIAKTR